MLHALSVLIIQAPLAEGVSPLALAAALSEEGGPIFLAGGYKTTEEMRKEMMNVRTLTSAPFGVNVLYQVKRT